MENTVVNNQTKIILLWVLLIVCMILHFNYHVSELIYGIDIRSKNASGTVPAHILYIRSAFHFLPIVYIVLVMWFNSKTVKIINLILAALYSLAHLFHLAGEIKKGDNPSQIVLLVITAILALLLTLASFYWNKNKIPENN